MNGFTIDLFPCFIKYGKVGIKLINFPSRQVINPKAIHLHGPILRNLRRSPGSSIHNISNLKGVATGDDFLGNESGGCADDAAYHDDDHADVNHDRANTTNDSFAGV